MGRSPRAENIRGVTIKRAPEFSHNLIFRSVQRYAPEINKRICPHLNLAGASYRLDETYIKVGTQWKYLYRALDKEGNTIEFMLSAKRDIHAAKRFFKKDNASRSSQAAVLHLGGQARLLSGCFQLFTNRESAAEGLQTLEDEISDEHRRTGPSVHPQEVASDAMLSLSRAED